jgi:hypothetical protein
MEVSMKKILLLTATSGLLLAGCYSTSINMSMGNMRQGASFLSKAGKEYRFKCVKAEENEVLIPIPGTTIEATPKTESK